MFGFFKRRNTGTSTAPAPAQNVNSVSTANPIDSAIMNHLTMKTNGALMVTGDWGSGKTHYIKTTLFPEIEKKTKLKPIIVSVYGAKDKESIAQKVVFTFWDSYASNKVSFQKITQGLTKLASAVPYINKFVNVEKILTANGENLLKMLPRDEIVICFDDVERISDKLDINDFLGLVNELVENRREKVILIANAKKFQKNSDDEKDSKKLIFLEKTVEKTIHYFPDMSVVLDNIWREYQAGAYQDFLKRQKTWLLTTLQVADGGATELKAELSNIRTIKFAIEHFRLVFEAVVTTKKPDEQLVVDQLKSTWLFVIGLSVVFRSGGKISLEDTNHLEEPEPTLADIDLDFTKATVLSGAPEPEEAAAAAGDPRAFAKQFRIDFYHRLSQTYRFYNEIFRLITGGQAIDAATLNADLDQQFYTPEGQVNPAQALVDKFVSGGWWTFKDAEFKPKLEELLNYGKEGKYDNPVSYLNASVFLFGFKDVIGKTEDEIVTELKTGLDQYFGRINYNHFVETQFDMSKSHFSNTHAKQLVAYMKEGFRKIQEHTEQSAAAALESLFINNLSGFVKETLYPSSRIRTPYEPVFNFFSDDAISEGLKVWEPESIMDLASFMELRYRADSFLDRLRDEQPFLEKLIAALSPISDGDKPLSAHLIHKELIPKTKAAVSLLKSLPPPESEIEYGEATVIG